MIYISFLLVLSLNKMNILKGFRMGPTVQQGGTQTIQQSIYLTHNNPCGINLLIFEELGATKITYVQLKDILDGILKTEEVLDMFTILREKGTAYLYTPNPKTQIEYLYAAMNWGKEAAKFIPDTVYPGYRWRISVFDYNGVMVWDNFAPSLEIVRFQGTDLRFTEIPLVTEFRTITGEIPQRTFKNPFLLPTRTSAQLYGICNNTTALSFLNRRIAIADRATRSSYLVNQAALPEATMAITSLLTDPANTRVFGIPKYGFSARQNTFNTSLLGYHCAYLNEIWTLEETPTLIETMFIRLSLEQRPLGAIL